MSWALRLAQQQAGSEVAHSRCTATPVVGQVGRTERSKRSTRMCATPGTSAADRPGAGENRPRLMTSRVAIEPSVV